MLNLQNKQNQFLKKGYTVLQNSISSDNTDLILKRLKSKILYHAKEMQLSRDKYLNVISRWANPSVITGNLIDIVKKDIKNSLNIVFETEVILKKWNVICKNSNFKSGVPYHQDISYSPNNPYQFTTWLALNDVCEESGPLEVCPGTHKGDIQPAVDFWSPEYKGTQKQGIPLTVKKGDIILFDSRIWHGSSTSATTLDRYALVARWSLSSYCAPKNIPEIQPYKFGMWTCGEETQRILSLCAQKLFNITSSDFSQLLEIWIDKIPFLELSFRHSREEIISAIKNVKILHAAFRVHNGGDASGNIYKKLWYIFLEPLQTHVDSLP